MLKSPTGQRTDTDCRVSSSPWQWFALGKGERPLFLIRNQCFSVTNYWADVQLCFVRVR